MTAVAPNSGEADWIRAVRVVPVRLMYRRGLAREDILELFRVIDWPLRLPEDLEQEFIGELLALRRKRRCLT